MTQPILSHTILHGELTSVSCARVMDSLLYLYLHTLPHEETTDKVFRLYINSMGGDLEAALGLYDVMQDAKNAGVTVETYGVGEVASAACLLLVGGSQGHRHVGKNCVFSMHLPEFEILAAGSMTKEACVKDAASITNAQKTYLTIMADNSKIQGKKLHKLAASQTDVYATEALKYGFADNIIGG